MIEWMMIFAGGFLSAVLLALMLMELVHDRAVRVTRRRVQETLPKSIAEAHAHKEGLRAAFAVEIRRLEMTVEQLQFKAATQTSEIARRDAAIERLKAEVATKAATALDLATTIEAVADAFEAAEREHAGERTELAAANGALAARAAELERRIAALNSDVAATAQELDLRAGRIATLEQALAKRQRSLSQRDAEMKLLFRAITAIKPDAASEPARAEHYASA